MYQLTLYQAGAAFEASPISSAQGGGATALYFLNGTFRLYELPTHRGQLYEYVRTALWAGPDREAAVVAVAAARAAATNGEMLQDFDDIEVQPDTAAPRRAPEASGAVAEPVSGVELEVVPPQPGGGSTGGDNGGAAHIWQPLVVVFSLSAALTFPMHPVGSQHACWVLSALAAEYPVPMVPHWICAAARRRGAAWGHVGRGSCCAVLCSRGRSARRGMLLPAPSGAAALAGAGDGAHRAGAQPAVPRGRSPRGGAATEPGHLAGSASAACALLRHPRTPLGTAPNAVHPQPCGRADAHRVAAAGDAPRKPRRDAAAAGQRPPGLPRRRQQRSDTRDLATPRDAARRAQLAQRGHHRLDHARLRLAAVLERPGPRARPHVPRRGGVVQADKEARQRRHGHARPQLRRGEQRQSRQRPCQCQAGAQQRRRHGELRRQHQHAWECQHRAARRAEGPGGGPREALVCVGRPPQRENGMGGRQGGAVSANGAAAEGGGRGEWVRVHTGETGWLQLGQRRRGDGGADERPLRRGGAAAAVLHAW